MTVQLSIVIFTSGDYGTPPPSTGHLRGTGLVYADWKRETCCRILLLLFSGEWCASLWPQPKWPCHWDCGGLLFYVSYAHMDYHIFIDNDFGCYFVLVTAAVHSRCMAHRFTILTWCTDCCRRYMVTYLPPNCNGACNCFVLVGTYWPTSLV